MAHQRKLIGQGLIAQLVAANTAAGTRVGIDRVDPYKKGGTPVISVYALSEDIDRDSASTRPRELKRTVKYELAGFVAGGDEASVANAMDDIAEQIEAAMDADPYIGGKAADSILDGTAMEIREGGSSDPLIGIIALTYSVTYRTSPAAPSDLDDFRTVDATHKIAGGVPSTVPASDTFTVQETPP